MTLVGRDRQLATLDEVLEQAASGRGELVALIGDAGIGKSALVDALARRAGADWAVVRGRAWEMSDAPAWFPVWPALEQLGLPVPPQQQDGGFLLWQEVLAALTAAAAERPVMWIVEDVHVADLATLRLLGFLGASIGALRVVIAVTLRPAPDNADAAARALIQLVRGARAVELGPLSADEAAALAKQIIDRPIEGGLASELFARTGGNPLFVTECARAMCLPLGRRVRHPPQPGDLGGRLRVLVGLHAPHRGHAARSRHRRAVGVATRATARSW